MPSNIPNDMKKQETTNLKYRYLLWLYKTVKEELDRIDRKFTQVEIDREIEKHLVRNAHLSQVGDSDKFRELQRAWQEYVDKKETDGKILKYDGEKLRAEYYFTKMKFEMVEKMINRMFGDKVLKGIETAYEEEMCKRILESREH